MEIGGFKKLSLIDYPDKLSAVVWTMGCNLRCPFCFNADLVFRRLERLSEQEILQILKDRKRFLDGICISGGEPTIQSDLIPFMQKLKNMGYDVKLDTNGTNPEVLDEVISQEVVDYVAMDVKAPIEKYDDLTGVCIEKDDIQCSIDVLRESGIEHEFRTTYVPSLMRPEDILEIIRWLDGAGPYYVQRYESKPPHVSTDTESDRMPFGFNEDLQEYVEKGEIMGCRL